MALTEAPARTAASSIVSNYAPDAPGGRANRGCRVADRLATRLAVRERHAIRRPAGEHTQSRREPDPALWCVEHPRPVAPGAGTCHRGPGVITLGLSGDRRPETRSYTTAIVNGIESAAAGTGGGVASATAAIAAAAGTWARGLALATIEPRNRRTAAITPQMLAMVGRALCRSGEIVFDLDVSGGRMRMLPASAAYVVVGSGDRRTRLYTGNRRWAGIHHDGLPRAGRRRPSPVHGRPRSAVVRPSPVGVGVAFGKPCSTGSSGN